MFRKGVFSQRHTLRAWLWVIEKWGEEGFLPLAKIGPKLWPAVDTVWNESLWVQETQECVWEWHIPNNQDTL